MSEPIVLGTAGESPLALDLERLIGSHLGIVANSGGGKSGLIRKLLEATHGHVQHIVLDSEDEFYTLRERHEYVIAGGDGGDTPATVDNAAQLALAALTHGFSLICQINDLGRAGANEFIDRFLTAMIAAPKELWRPCLVVIDEVQRFDETAIGKLTGEGRKRGFTAVLATQRLPKMDANVRGDLNNWIMGRVGQSLDRRNMADQLGMAPSEARALAQIEPRHFYAFGPALSRDPVLFRVSDVATTMVRPGQAKVHTPPPPEALREILSGMAAAPAKSISATTDAGGKIDAERTPIGQAEIDEIVQLRARIAEIEAERDGLVAEHGYGQQQLDALVAENRKLRDIIEAAWRHAKLIKPALEGGEIADPSTGVEKVNRAEKSQQVPPAREASTGGRHEVAQRQEGNPVGRSAGRPSTSPDGMGGLAKRFLAEIESRHPARLSWEQWAALVQRKPKGAQFNNAKAELRTSGRIDENEVGVKATIASGTPKSRAEVIEAWRRVLPSMALKIFDAVRDGGDGSYEEIAERIDRQPQGAQWNAAISQLRNNGLIADVPGRVVLIDLLPGESG